MSNASSKVRLMGGILLVVGLLLSGGMAWLIWWMTDVIAHPSDSSRWTGGPLFTAATLRLLWSVLFFGLTSCVMGVAQTVSGRRVRALVIPFLVSGMWLVLALVRLLSLQSTM